MSIFLALATSVLAMTTKTVYLIRHAETEENIRMQRLFNVGKSLKRCRPPTPTDVYYGCQFLGMATIGRTNSILSVNGKDQIEEMYKILLQENFTEKLSLVAHSPLIRAKETCYGILDLNSDNDSPQLVELDCLSEVTPYETLLQGRLPLWKRINSLYKWIQNQEADTIALVGHSEYFKIMLGLKEKFKNCDVWKATYSNGQWKDLELKHRLSGFS